MEYLKKQTKQEIKQTFPQLQELLKKPTWIKPALSKNPGLWTNKHRKPITNKCKVNAKGFFLPMKLMCGWRGPISVGWN